MIKNLLIVVAAFLFSLSLNAQYCTAVGPASGADSNLQTLSLIGESSSINFVGCPGVVGLDDQTLIHSVDLSPGIAILLMSFSELVVGTMVLLARFGLIIIKIKYLMQENLLDLGLELRPLLIYPWVSLSQCLQ